MLKRRILGSIIIGIAVIFLISLIVFKIQINTLTEQLMIETGGSCIKDNECLHEQSDIPMYIGIAIAFITLALGIYLIAFEKSQEYVESMQREIVSSLKDSRKKQDKNDRFEFLLKALNEEEKKIMKAIKEQDGIEQATLRIRTDLSKTKLSVVLTELEKKNLIKKVAEGKKNRIYLKNTF